jgi:hypothetical protein
MIFIVKMPSLGGMYRITIYVRVVNPCMMKIAIDLTYDCALEYRFSKGRAQSASMPRS